jgi:hypothetical protein
MPHIAIIAIKYRTPKAFRIIPVIAIPHLGFFLTAIIPMTSPTIFNGVDNIFHAPKKDKNGIWKKLPEKDCSPSRIVTNPIINDAIAIFTPPIKRPLDWINLESHA